jgi:serine/threonine protein kinase
MADPMEITQNPERHLPIGTQLQGGKYTILDVLGQGGFGITYLVKHNFLDEKLALKELFLNSGTVHCSRENTAGRQVIVHFEPQQFIKFKNRFIEEAKTLRKLSPVQGIVHVLDVFEENGTAYFAMDYLQGAKLSDYVKKNGPISEEEGLRIIKSLGLIVSNVHQHSILHRDIKPDNIIMSPDGKVNLIDFGIAKQYISEIDQTHTTFHSPRYSPPEQKASKSKMGTYSDVFSLGATAYYLFTGIPPQSLEDRLLQDFVPPIEHKPNLSPAINEIICQSMILKTSNRIQTAEKFIAALNGITILSESAQNPKNESPAQEPNEENEDTEVYPTTEEDHLTISSHSGEDTEIDQKTKNVENEVVLSPRKEPEDEDKTKIDPIHSEKQKRSIDWEDLKVIPQNLYLWCHKNKRFALGILFFFLVIVSLIVIFSRTEKDSSNLIEEEKWINIYITDNKNQQIQDAEIRFSFMDSVIFLEGTNSLTYKLDSQNFSTQYGIMKVQKEGYFPEERKIADLFGDTLTQIELTSIALANIDSFVNNLIQYDWVNEQNEKAVFTTIDTAKVNFNPSGNAKLNDQDAIWFIDRTRDSTFLIIRDTTLKEEELARFFIPLSKIDSAVIFLTRIDSNSGVYSRKDKEDEEAKPIILKRPKVPSPVPRIWSGKVVDEQNRPLANVTLKIENTTIVVKTNSRGRFKKDLTSNWNSLKRKRYIVSLQKYQILDRSLASDIAENNLLIILKRETETLNCLGITGFWSDSRNILNIKSCSGNQGDAEFNGIEGKWIRFDDENNVYVQFNAQNNRISQRFLVQNPSNSQSIQLSSSGQSFLKTTKPAILCKKIMGSWTYKRRRRRIDVKITSCKNSIGMNFAKIIHNGDIADLGTSSIKENSDPVILLFTARGKTYLIKVEHPLTLDKKGLKIKQRVSSSSVDWVSMTIKQ